MLYEEKVLGKKSEFDLLDYKIKLIKSVFIDLDDNYVKNMLEKFGGDVDEVVLKLSNFN